MNGGLRADAGCDDSPTCLSLFSGVGGLDLGLQRAGFRHLLLCESDPWRRDVLRARFPGVPVADDVCEVAEGSRPGRLRTVGGGDDVADIGRGRSLAEDGDDRVDLVAGGSPCQDLSVAGQRRGLDLEGGRSNLFYEMARVIDAVRPRWVLWENVPGAFSSQGGRDFGAVLGTLADLGYGLGWRVLDSRFFGVPQRRRRVFVVGALADGDPRAAAERAGQVLAVGSRCGWHPATRGETGPEVAAALAGRSASRLDDQGTGQLIPHYYVEDHEDGPLRANGSGGFPRIDKQPLLVAAPLTSGGHPNSNAPGRRQEDDEHLVEATHVSAGSSVRTLTPTECERLQGFPDGWTDLGGTPDSRRYSALGDAVTVNVAHWIGERIARD